MVEIRAIPWEGKGYNEVIYNGPVGIKKNQVEENYCSFKFRVVIYDEVGSGIFNHIVEFGAIDYKTAYENVKKFADKKTEELGGDFYEITNKE